MADDTLWQAYATTLPSDYNLRRYMIRNNELPERTTLQTIYISGSELSIEDKEARSLKTYFQHFFQETDTPKRIAGTCFGAQALASWALNKRVIPSCSPEENIFRTFTIQNILYTGHFNHEWFIAADELSDWKIYAKKTFSLTNAFAKTERRTCVDFFSASLGKIELLGTMAHPHILPTEGRSTAPLVNAFLKKGIIG
jgi:hypothetical protein